ncbi:MAG TPA: adenylate/guanylate cyclase domain-containing protein [Pseudomonadales bacterium]|nr:adenylate/guanylate cyclase domain-containing protein [Pseudomonadales bacterium]
MQRADISLTILAAMVWAGIDKEQQMEYIRNSIGLKIFSVVSLIVLLMVCITVMNLRVQAQVSAALDQVANRYIMIYGDMSHANVRSVEEALYIRRLIIAKFLLKDDVAAQALADDVTQNIKAFDEDIAKIRQQIAAGNNGDNIFSDAVTMARIDEKLALAQTLQQQKLSGLQEKVLHEDVEGLRQDLPMLGVWRKDFNTYLEDTRQLLLEATQRAAADAMQLQQRAMRISVIAVLLASLLALAVAAWITRSLVRPVRALLHGTQSVIGGQLDVDLPVTTSDEIGHLTQSFNKMAEGLRTGNRVRDIFGKYVDPRIVEDLIEKPQLMSSEGERQTMTVLFCDMQDFTRLSETLTPAALVKLLNRYFTLISEAVHENGGVIDKFIGDAVMAYWGKPFNAENEQAERALGAAAAMKGKVEQLQQELPQLLGLRTNLPVIGVRAGIATGEAIVGNIGSDRTRNFTIIGDTVNLASRLEVVNKLYNTNVLVTEETAAMATGFFLREVDTIIVPGKTEAKRIFDVLGVETDITPEQKQLAEYYAVALSAYRQQDWSAAREALLRCLTTVPDDGPATALLARLVQFEKHPPAKNWDGAWAILQK